MNTRHAVTHPPGGLQVSEWVLGVVGGIAVFLGLFILIAGEDQYLGLGGEMSWRVGDISPAWGFGLLVVGVLAVILAGGLVRRDRHRDVVAVQRSGRTDLLVHAVVFVLVNGFIWVQDIALGGGSDYAYWITLPWAVGLGAHAVSVFAGERHPSR